MMLKKHLFLLTLTTVLCNNQIVATDMMHDEMAPEKMMSDAEVRGCCKKYKCINVCGDATIGGSLNVGGSVTASSFITPAGLLFSGLRNYANLTNQTAITTGSTVLWAATPAANLSSGLSLNSAGFVSLPTTGFFIVQYTVRLNILLTSIQLPALATAQLLQNGLSVAPALNSNSTIINTPAPGDVLEIQLSGYAFVNASNGNNLSLFVTFDDGYSIPATTGTDANAEMVILQIN